MTRKLKLLAVCSFAALLLAGCGGNSELKSELENVELTMELPPVRITDCRYLSQADDEVYRQQLAACEMYNEAYRLTDGKKYLKKYKGKIKNKKVFHECYERRKKLDLDIATALNDNVNAVVYSVEDCDNIQAYLRRVIDDTEDFYDYYDAYVNAENDIKPACNILKAFYERSNILAFRFMEEHKDDIISAAVQQIVKNSLATEDMHKYISDNNDLVRALNTVYGGVPQEYTEIITSSEIRLVRRMLEEAKRFSDEDLDKLMRQLGEATPEPEATAEPTDKPTEEPTDKPTEEPVREIRTEAPVRTAAPTPVPTRAPTMPPVQATSVPVQPRVVEPEEPEEPEPSAEVYIFD